MFNFKTDYVLENQRVRLSPLSTDHSETLMKLTNDPAIWTYFLENGLGSTNFKKYFSNALAKKVTGIEYPFVIYDKQKVQIAGMTRVYNID